MTLLGWVIPKYFFVSLPNSQPTIPFLALLVLLALIDEARQATRVSIDNNRDYTCGSPLNLQQVYDLHVLSHSLYKGAAYHKLLLAV